MKYLLFIPMLILGCRSKPLIVYRMPLKCGDSIMIHLSQDSAFHVSYLLDDSSHEVVIDRGDTIVLHDGCEIIPYKSIDKP